MPRTTLALKFGLYAPAVMGPLFLALSVVCGGLPTRFDAALLVPSVLVLSYLTFGPSAFATGLLAAIVGPTLERWELYQIACVAICAVLTGAGYLAFVGLMGARSDQDRVLFWIAAITGALTAALGARWTRKEHAEAVRDRFARIRH